MRIALAQINPTVGAFAKNTEKILGLAREYEKSSDMIVFPELAVTGYPPLDLLDQEAFASASEQAIKTLCEKLPQNLVCLVGFVARNESGRGKSLTNSVAVIHQGKVIFKMDKTLLPTYDVFDEARYFESAHKREVFVLNGKKIGIAICEDIWWDAESMGGENYSVDPVEELLALGADLLIVPSASPYTKNKLVTRIELCKNISRDAQIPVVYVNMTGANDSLIFDGRSFCVNSSAHLSALAPFEESCMVIETESTEEIELTIDTYEEMEKALVSGIRDYMAKCGFKKAHLGLSGGIDSALVAVLAVKALGKENVKGFALPSRYSSDGSKSDAYDLAKRLGIECDTIAIEKPFASLLETLEPVFNGLPFDLAEENLQARIRGILLMAYSNKFNSMLLTTGNKSELATGYCTLYGDMCGALAVIGDLFKTEVYALCESINSREELIPRSTITKAPSAELRPDQKDQDSLPEYAVLDAILDEYLINNKSAAEIIELDFDSAVVHKILSMVARSEYKRRQAPPVLKISSRAFGMGRRMPIARSSYEA